MATVGEKRAALRAIFGGPGGEVSPAAYDALSAMLIERAGFRVVTIANGPVAHSFGFGDVGVIATRAKVEDDRYTGELEFYCYGEAKAAAMREVAAREGLDLAGSYAYSDSITDLPMLEAVGHPVAVNPDRELRREADRRGWQIRDFRRPVRLRERLPQVPASGPSVAAAVAGALAVLLGWRYVRRLADGRRASRG